MSLTVAQGLKDKGCDVKVVDSAANLIKTMVSKEHDVIGISVNHASCNSLIKIIDQKTNIPILVYGEDRREPTMKKIQIANAEYKVNGVLTAYNAWMKIHGRFKEKMKEDFSTPESKKKEKKQEDSDDNQSSIVIKGSGKTGYDPEEEQQNNKKRPNYYLDKGENKKSDFKQQQKEEKDIGRTTTQETPEENNNGQVRTSGKKLNDLGTVTNAQKKAIEKEQQQQAAAGTKPKFTRSRGKKKKGSRLMGKANKPEENKTSTRKAPELETEKEQKSNPMEATVERDESNNAEQAAKQANNTEQTPQQPGKVHNLTKDAKEGELLAKESQETSESDKKSDKAAEKNPGSVDARESANKAPTKNYEEDKELDIDNTIEKVAKKSESKLTKKENKEVDSPEVAAKKEESGAMGDGVDVKESADNSKVINIEKELKKNKKNPNFAKEFQQIVEKASDGVFVKEDNQQADFGNVKQVSVVPVENHGDVGYLLFCSEKTGTVSLEEIEEFKKTLKESENTEIVGDLKVGDIFTVDIVETDMQEWAKNYGQFHYLVKSEKESNNGNVVVCFITKEQVYPNLSKEENLNLYRIDLDEVPPMLPVNFSAFLYLRKNDRVLPYLNKGGYLSEEQIDRLNSYGFNSLFIKEEDIQAYYNFFVAKSINQDLSPKEESKDKQEKDSAEVVPATDQEQKAA